MSEKISIKLLENDGLTKILFNKSYKTILFELYGDNGFYYNGKISSNSNNINILFETVKDKIIFIKITEIGSKKQKFYSKFFNFNKKIIKKNVSMKISNIESSKECDTLNIKECDTLNNLNITSDNDLEELDSENECISNEDE